VEVRKRGGTHNEMPSEGVRERKSLGYTGLEDRTLRMRLFQHEYIIPVNSNFFSSVHTDATSLTYAYANPRKEKRLKIFNESIQIQSIYIETSVSNKCRCSFYCALLTLHVSAPIGGHLQVVL
jgi:hypothetical protein